ncbi:adhesion G protein-coupled receptor F5-like [Pagrus major]|uniref:adhesion G protein-coupled receptor F5-like n=1 Tax=Pagrus major TaxID=143350 RepID=UPI003CC8837D
MTLPKAAGCAALLLVIYYILQTQDFSQFQSVLLEDLTGVKASHIQAREKRATTSNSSDYELQAVVELSDLERLQTLLNTLSLPLQINSTVEITSIDTTTVCSLNMTGYQCRCEQGFAWSYNSCITHGACDAIIGDTCGCINALPADGQYCQPNTSQPDPVDIDLVLDLRVPVSSAPSGFIDLFRQTVNGFPLPFSITQSLRVVGLNFTTGCSPNSTGGGLQCECEEHFAWSCDTCNSFGVCSNATGPTCGCINGLPSDGQFCEPITDVIPCPPTTPDPVDIDLVLELRVPVSSAPSGFIDLFRQTVNGFPLPFSITQSLRVVGLNFTTGCSPNSTGGGLQCECEEHFAWSCDTCNSFGVCKRNFSFSLDIDFRESYNNPTDEVYQNTFNAINQQAKEHISGPSTANLIRFRSGSTIADYSISATSFDEDEINAFQTGIFRQLGEIYPILYDSKDFLRVEPSDVFIGNRVTVTCGPPPDNLNLVDWRAEWRRNNVLIREDSEHSFSTADGEAKLTVSNFFSTDNGLYECTLTDNNTTRPGLRFRQRAGNEIILRETPVIRVKPVRIKVECVPQQVELQCSVNSPYEVEFQGVAAVSGTDISFNAQISSSDCTSTEKKFTCQVKNFGQFSREIALELSTEEFACKDDPVFGDGQVNDQAVGPCEENEVGEQIAFCNESGLWKVLRDSCILQVVQDLLNQSEALNVNSLPVFLDQLGDVTENFTAEIVESPATITAIVEILSNIALLGSPINRVLMEDVLRTAGVLTTDDARDSWVFLNSNDTSNMLPTRSNVPTTESVSSTLLLSLENITGSLTNDSFDIDTPFILLNKTAFTETFNADFNSSVGIDVQESDGGRQSITVITFASMDNILPARDEANSTSNVINGRVVLVRSNSTINNVSFTFDVINTTLTNPQCVFWNFSLFSGLGGWDDEGCELEFNVNDTVTCNCNHLTSFSILMSPFSPNNPVLDIITYIGVGISMASLVICLIIEAVIWRKIRKNNTSYLRHVSVVNIAVSLLIANIWFIIGAAITDEEVKNRAACSTATFFIHFFYLALFFWMFASALLLLYRTVNVFDGGLSKKSMLAIGFVLGYGGPLIIAIITIAVTEPRQVYIRQTGECWLNWDESMALLAFVIPALLIVAINFVILLVVIYKMLRRRAVGDAAQAAERHVLVVILRSLAVLTPFFGLTWALGVGTMTPPYNEGVHISFAFFNSLQGFFILVFGTLFDRKVRSEIAIKSQTSSSGTRSTSAGNSSSSGFGFFRNLRRGRDGYNLSSSASGVSQSFTDT